jgi:hypothetical protein
MLSAGAVDAMLKAKGFVQGSLYERIDEAATKGLITADMTKWAHQVRLLLLKSLQVSWKALPRLTKRCFKQRLMTSLSEGQRLN